MRNTPDITDVLVVGGGGTGLAAAVAAAERGVRVHLIERRDVLGGTTALSVGSFCEAGTRMQRRLGDDRNAVVGAEYTRRGQTHQIHAKRGVILATGDFSGNPAMRREFLGPSLSNAPPTNPHSTGDGQRLARAIGAASRNMDFT